MTGREDFELELRVDDDDWNAVKDLEEIVHRAYRAGLECAGVSPGDAGATIVLADDLTVAQLNQHWRDKEQATNILSFPAPDGEKSETGRRYLGDIILASGVVTKEADQQGKSLATHLCHLVIHGVLHLLDHDHMDDEAAKKMEDLERTAMTALNLPDPYFPAGVLQDKIAN